MTRKTRWTRSTSVLVASVLVAAGAAHGRQIEDTLPESVSRLDNDDALTSWTGNWKVGRHSRWHTSKSKRLWYGATPVFARRSGSFTFAPQLEPGRYRVYLCWPTARGMNRRVPVSVRTTNGAISFEINQRSNQGRWNLIGVFDLDRASMVRLSARGDNRTAADGVAFELIPGETPIDPVPDDPFDPPLDPPPGDIPSDTPPAAPVGLEAVGGQGRVSLSWTANTESDLRSYSIFRSTDPRGEFAELASGQTGTTFRDAGVENGVAYFYFVVAVDNAGQTSEPSELVEAVPVDSAPAAPTGLVASGERGAIDLDWNNNRESDLAGYAVYRSTAFAGPYDLLADRVRVSAYSDDSVTTGARYYYVVIAFDESNNESESSSVVWAESIDDPPTVPTNIVANFSEGAVRVAWSDSPDEDFESFTLFRAVGSGAYELLAGNLSASSYVDRSVSAGNSYRYVVVVRDLGGNTSSSAEVSVTIDAPESSVTISWNRPTENADGSTLDDLAGFTVHYGTRSGVYTEALAVGNVTQAVIALPSAGTYYFAVTAHDETGNVGPLSAEVSKSVGVPDRSATLAWEPPARNTDGSPVTDLAGYSVHVGANSGLYTQTIDVGGLRQYSVDLPGPGTYYFVITARDEFGNVSAFSEERTKTVN